MKKEIKKKKLSFENGKVYAYLQFFHNKKQTRKTLIKINEAITRIEMYHYG